MEKNRLFFVAAIILLAMFCLNVGCESKASKGAGGGFGAIMDYQSVKGNTARRALSDVGHRVRVDKDREDVQTQVDQTQTALRDANQ